MHKQAEQDDKKQYQTPVLTVHGTVLKLTQKVGLHGSSDGGSFPRIRTSA